MNSTRPFMLRSRRRSFIALGTGLALGAALMGLSAYWARQSALAAIAKRSAITLNLIVENLRGELGKYLFQPHLLAANPNLKTVLRGAATHSEIQALNTELERINNASGALDIYLMDRWGQTLASSNWSSPRSFVGENFAYRPYFKAAMQGQLGRYFALGSASHQRGYYFAYPVRDQSSILGVIAVKMQVGDLEQSWLSPNHHIAVIDFDNVIFLSTNPDWRFHTLGKMPKAVRRRLDESRKYDGRPLPPLALLADSEASGWGRLMTIATPADKEQVSGQPRARATQFLVREVTMADAGWRVLLFARTQEVTGRIAVTLAVTGSVLLSLGLIAVIVVQRRRRSSERIRLQEQARVELEERVRERTDELTRANRSLKTEIRERHKAEQELRQTQDGLIQASKLAALGQMSAGLSHELNQPLAAIRTYADNAGAFLERGQLATVTRNLTGISELTQRMARIIKILRTYARDEPHSIRPVSVTRAIDESLSLLDQRIHAENVRVHFSVADAELYASGGDVRLQQVLVNLITNALDAMRQVPEKLLEIRAGRDGATVVVTIADSGPGIPRAQLDRVFDPFFTTKEVGQGMGLGLSITYGIVKQFGGTIKVRNRDTGGAEFKLLLAAAQPPEGRS